MANKLIGRERERKELEELYHSDRPIFAVIYGRRRVGKTYLVRQMFEKQFAFCHTGLSPFELSAEKIVDQQLRAFYGSLVQYGSKLNEIPKTWFDAFASACSISHLLREARQATKTFGKQTSSRTNSQHGAVSLLKLFVSITSAR